MTRVHDTFCQTDPPMPEPEEAEEPVSLKRPFDVEVFGTDDLIPKPRVEFMCELESFPESKLPARLPDGTLINLNFSNVRDWADSSLYTFVTANFIRNKLAAGEIKLMQDEVRPETPDS